MGRALGLMMQRNHERATAMTNTTPKYYLLATYREGVEGFMRGNPIRSYPMTMKEAKRALAWQVTGGFDAAEYTICVASEIPGIMTPHDNPKMPVLLMKGALTLIYYKEMVTSIWGGAE